MFALVFDSDSENESLIIIMALMLIAQLAPLLCGLVSVCYTCTGMLVGPRSCRNP